MRRAILSVARKNGKSALIAALILAHLVGPEATVNGEIYSAANDREQAAQVFKVARQIVEADPELLAMVLPVPSTKTLVCKRNGSFFRALSAEAGTKHGLNPTFVVYDELAQSKSRDLYDVLDTSMGARAEPLFVVISTQSNDPEHILSRLIDDGMQANDPTIVCHLYAVPDEVENIWDEDVWRLANPALGDFRSMSDFRSLALKAQRWAAEEPKFRNLYLNQRYSAAETLIPPALWRACAGDFEIEDRAEIYLSLDLASVNDLAALIAVTAGAQTKVAAWFWKPSALLEEHSDRDFGAGTRRYCEWADTGLLEKSAPRAIDPGSVAAKVAELCGRYTVLGLAYDRWRIAEFIRQLNDIGVPTYKDGEAVMDGSLRIVSWGQGYRDMAPAVDALERDVIEGRIVHPNHPILNWNLMNAQVSTDPAGNRKLDKSASRLRIDGAQALAQACGLKARDAVPDVPAASPWDDPDFSLAAQ